MAWPIDARDVSYSAGQQVTSANLNAIQDAIVDVSSSYYSLTRYAWGTLFVAGGAADESWEGWEYVRDAGGDYTIYPAVTPKSATSNPRGGWLLPVPGGGVVTAVDLIYRNFADSDGAITLRLSQTVFDWTPDAGTAPVSTLLQTMTHTDAATGFFAQSWTGLNIAVTGDTVLAVEISGANAGDWFYTPRATYHFPQP
jgi:hypothetical protein